MGLNIHIFKTLNSFFLLFNRIMKHKLTDLEKRVNYYAGIICIG